QGLIAEQPIGFDHRLFTLGRQLRGIAIAIAAERERGRQHHQEDQVEWRQPLIEPGAQARYRRRIHRTRRSRSATGRKMTAAPSLLSGGANSLKMRKKRSFTFLRTRWANLNAPALPSAAIASRWRRAIRHSRRAIRSSRSLGGTFSTQ